MRNDIYLNSKSILKDTAKQAKESNPKDKPYVREVLNNQLDQLDRQINHYVMNDKISQKRANLYIKWLTNYCISLHP